MIQANPVIRLALTITVILAVTACVTSVIPEVPENHPANPAIRSAAMHPSNILAEPEPVDPRPAVSEHWREKAPEHNEHDKHQHHGNGNGHETDNGHPPRFHDPHTLNPFPPASTDLAVK